MTAPSPHGERSAVRTLVPLPAATALVCAAVVAGTVPAAPASVRTPLAWGAGLASVVLVAAVFWAVRAGRTARSLRRRLHTVTQDAERLAQERHRTAEEAQRERQHLIDELSWQRAEFAESLAHERVRAEEGAARETDRLAQDNARLTGELERAHRARDAAISATSNAAGRMQALTTAMLADLRAMEERHSDEDVLADLLHLDHRTAQAGRLADSVAVLTGARSGRRWARPIAMESILRGAMGRISAYRRVRVHAASETAVAGHAAEGVMHALAELLDNAANFSPPTSEVHVYVEEVPAGVILSVEDSGLVMGEVQLRRAERAVAGDVSELGGLTGTRLGLAVVGRLALKYGLKVSFRPSARGGTGVLMLIPQDILTSPVASPSAPSAPSAPVRPAAAPARDIPGAGSTATAESAATGGDTARPTAPDDAPAAEPSVPAASTAPASGDPAPVHESVPDGTDGDTAEWPVALPKRRRGRTLADAERTRNTARTPAPRPAAAAEDVKTRAARFGSFRQAVRPGAADHAAAPGPATGPQPDGGDATAPPAPADLPSHPTAHPEGDATS
ncbi:sensor histidine kinase [Streptomyces sp. PsTaAH-124]|uniref:sensor histidine kinase n=1 Tax=Streptomyces sp. PsTaAH-124 TaxID=1157638 RepID=UPI00035E2E66|nr:ATP-binding protein [Streptomyces sp. PsTaAH-124]